MIQLDVQRATLVADRDRGVQAAGLDPQVIEEAQGLAGEVAQLRVMPLALEFGDDHDR